MLQHLNVKSYSCPIGTHGFVAGLAGQASYGSGNLYFIESSNISLIQLAPAFPRYLFALASSFVCDRPLSDRHPAVSESEWCSDLCFVYTLSSYRPSEARDRPCGWRCAVWSGAYDV